MQLTVRDATQQDFEAWFEMERTCFDLAEEIRPQAKREWSVIIASPARLTLIMEDQERPPTERLVGFGGHTI